MDRRLDRSQRLNVIALKGARREATISASHKAFPKPRRASRASKTNLEQFFWAYRREEEIFFLGLTTWYPDVCACFPCVAVIGSRMRRIIKHPREILSGIVV